MNRVNEICGQQTLKLDVMTRDKVKRKNYDVEANRDFKNFIKSISPKAGRRLRTSSNFAATHEGIKIKMNRLSVERESLA